MSATSPLLRGTERRVDPPPAFGGAAPWHQAAGTNPVDVFLGRQADSHLRTARSTLNCMAAHFSGNRLDAYGFPWWQLTYAQVSEFRGKVARELKPQSARNYMSALRSLLRECKRLGLLSPADFENLTDIPPIRGETLPAGRHVTPTEIDKLFAYLDTLDSAADARDRAAFAVLRGTGIRRAEACADAGLP